MGYRRGLAEKRRKEMEEEVRRLRDVLPTLPEVKRAWVIGSFSRGEVRARSDLDLILEVESEESFEKRWERYYLALRPRVPTDLWFILRRNFRSLRSGPSSGGPLERRGSSMRERVPDWEPKRYGDIRFTISLRTPRILIRILIRREMRAASFRCLTSTT